MKKQLILLFIFSFSSINANLLKEYSIGFAPSFGFISGEAFSNPPVGSTFFIKTPFGLNFGSSNLSLSLGAGSYTGYYEGYENNPLFFGLGLNLTLAELLFAESHFGNLGHGQGFRTSAGITLSRLMKNLPVTASIGSEFFLTNDLDGRGGGTLWAGLAVKIEYLIGGKAKQSSGGSGPSAPNQRPTESTGNAKIDDFITKTYDLNDKIIDLKEKATSISYGLSESNEVLSDIGTHPKSPLGWSFFRLRKGFLNLKIV